MHDLLIDALTTGVPRGVASAIAALVVGLLVRRLIAPLAKKLTHPIRRWWWSKHEYPHRHGNRLVWPRELQAERRLRWRRGLRRLSRWPVLGRLAHGLWRLLRAHEQGVYDAEPISAGAAVTPPKGLLRRRAWRRGLRAGSELHWETIDRRGYQHLRSLF